MGVQQGILHTDRFDDSIELIRAETFNKALVERGRGVVDDLMGYQWSATGLQQTNNLYVPQPPIP